MSDERKVPPLPHRVVRDISGGSDDEVFIPPAPDTERLPSAPPRKPHEPFRLVQGRAPSYVEFAAIVKHVDESLTLNAGKMETVLATQRKMALQQDGLVRTVNQRFDIFHEELALIRHTVTGDHAPRITAVERDVDHVEERTEKVEKTVGEKARKIGLDFGKYAGALTLVALLARAVGRKFPEYYDVIDGVLGAVGL